MPASAREGAAPASKKVVSAVGPAPLRARPSPHAPVSVAVPPAGISETPVDALRRLPLVPRQQALIHLSRLHGNRRVQQMVALLREEESGRPAPVAGQADAPTVMRYDIRLEGPAGARTDACLDSIAGQLTAWGISNANAGDINTINREVTIRDVGKMAPLTDAEVNQALSTIEAIWTNPVGYAGRVVASWKGNKDDLGGGRTYPHILHFAVAAERMAQHSMKKPFTEALTKVEPVRLAGLDIRVNPRSIYFAAAAQVAMDVAADVKAGQGHYIPPGAFFPELKAIQQQARRLAGLPIRGGRPRKSARPPPLDALGAKLFNAMLGQVLQMVKVMSAQPAPRTSQRAEHSEPGMKEYLAPLESDLQGLTEATTAEEARERAGRLNEILGTIPTRLRAHGGAFDPHSTTHALGVAIDLFSGTAGHSSLNFAIPGFIWPFVHLLLDESAPPSLAGIRPKGISRLEPEQAQDLATLLKSETCAKRADELRPVRPSKDPAERAAANKAAAAASSRRKKSLTGYNTLLRRVNGGLYLRWQLLTRATNRAAWYRSSPQVRELALQLVRQLISDPQSVPSLSPQQLQKRLDDRIKALQELCDLGREATVRQAEEDSALPAPEAQTSAAARRAERARLQAARRRKRARASDLEVLNRVDPTAGRAGTTLSDQQSCLSAQGQDDPAYKSMQTDFMEERIEQARRAVAKPGFGKWLTQVRALPSYDQPRILTDALNQVAGYDVQKRGYPVFSSAHHWDIAPLEILTNDTAYRQALQRDMRNRSKEAIKRILTTMAESAGGRRILKGSDPFFRAALDAKPHGNADALMSEALASVTPATGAGRSPAAEFLRSRGLHETAGAAPATSQPTAGTAPSGNQPAAE